MLILTLACARVLWSVPEPRGGPAVDRIVVPRSLIVVGPTVALALLRRGRVHHVHVRHRDTAVVISFLDGHTEVLVAHEDRDPPPKAIAVPVLCAALVESPVPRVRWYS